MLLNYRIKLSKRTIPENLIKKLNAKKLKKSQDVLNDKENHLYEMVEMNSLTWL